MIISDLSYLEVACEDAIVVGAGDTTTTTNVTISNSNIKQRAKGGTTKVEIKASVRESTLTSSADALNTVTIGL